MNESHNLTVDVLVHFQKLPQKADLASSCRDCLTSREAMTVLCSVLKHAGSG